ncbi:uncharacterized protein KY384_008880 [Bacidia gigantensis]|uniref:uncharacterized protein n=1 Tax=Bacidia gigantensis TaxID=2732470 RepID=UPI001D05194C|nr:uncharacterized protein KY384_008880 [Bacidia gigantensis]KAG8525236.1 hypothetical protein KY384_008880 [Bacidia gigantensis]
MRLPPLIPFVLATLPFAHSTTINFTTSNIPNPYLNSPLLNDPGTPYFPEDVSNPSNLTYNPWPTPKFAQRIPHFPDRYNIYLSVHPYDEPTGYPPLVMANLQDFLTEFAGRLRHEYPPVTTSLNASVLKSRDIPTNEDDGDQEGGGKIHALSVGADALDPESAVKYDISLNRGFWMREILTELAEASLEAFKRLLIRHGAASVIIAICEGSPEQGYRSPESVWRMSIVPLGR